MMIWIDRGGIRIGFTRSRRLFTAGVLGFRLDRPRFRLRGPRFRRRLCGSRFGDFRIVPCLLGSHPCLFSFFASQADFFPRLFDAHRDGIAIGHITRDHPIRHPI